jgi:hypothetical protein
VQELIFQTAHIDGHRLCSFFNASLGPGATKLISFESKLCGRGSGMGRQNTADQRRESDAIRPRFPARDARLWKLWSVRPLCRTGHSEPLDPCARERSFHTTHPLCTGLFQAPVGVVGKRGQAIHFSCHISKSPQLHSLDLEKEPHRQVAGVKAVRFDFHFSGMNYGYY